jgi:hypothetical protein
MTIGINTSPLAGQTGSKLTARLVKNRLDAELIGNVSIRMLATERPDTWEVQGRGELQLAILVELMRREGFEITVGKPQVVTRTIDGKIHEPVERLTVDIPEDYLGVVTQLMALVKWAPGGRAPTSEITGEPSYAVDICPTSRHGDHNHAAIAGAAGSVAVSAASRAPAWAWRRAFIGACGHPQ